MVSHAEVLMDLKNQHLYLKAMEIKKKPEIKVEVKNEGGGKALFQLSLSLEIPENHILISSVQEFIVNIWIIFILT